MSKGELCECGLKLTKYTDARPVRPEGEHWVEVIYYDCPDGHRWARKFDRGKIGGLR